MYLVHLTVGHLAPMLIWLDEILAFSHQLLHATAQQTVSAGPTAVHLCVVPDGPTSSA